MYDLLKVWAHSHTTSTEKRKFNVLYCILRVLTRTEIFPWTCTLVTFAVQTDVGCIAYGFYILWRHWLSYHCVERVGSAKNCYSTLKKNPLENNTTWYLWLNNLVFWFVFYFNPYLNKTTWFEKIDSINHSISPAACCTICIV
jgi:hypothetical protein